MNEHSTTLDPASDVKSLLNAKHLSKSYISWNEGVQSILPLFVQCHTYQFRAQDFVWRHAILVQFTVGCDLWQTYDWKTTVFSLIISDLLF